MTYAAYLGADTRGATATWVGSSPISFMSTTSPRCRPITARIFSKAGTTAVYTWDPHTAPGIYQRVAAPFTGPTDTGKIFSTVWTQGALTTYDLSAFNEDQIDDMRPGQWMTFSRAQIADLRSDVAAGTPEYQARGNIYNALLHDATRAPPSATSSPATATIISSATISITSSAPMGAMTTSTAAMEMIGSAVAPVRMSSSSAPAMMCCSIRWLTSMAM